MRWRLITTLSITTIACAVMAMSCAAPHDTEIKKIPDTLATTGMPFVYVGTLRDEPGLAVEFVLVLRSDSTFIMRTRFRRSDSASVGRFDELGRWRFARDGREIELSGRSETVAITRLDERALYIPKPGSTARDTVGRTLSLVDDYDMWVALRIRGIYRADTITDCETGASFRVIRGLQVKDSPGDFDSAVSLHGARPVMVDIEGQIPGGGRAFLDANHIVVTRLNATLPGDTCIKDPMTSITEHTWKLVRVGGETVDATGSSDRHPHMTITPDGTSVSGMAGCNRFQGKAALDGASVRFSNLMMTKMACDQLAIEQRFSQALYTSRTWRIVDAQLELVDGSGNVVAQFIPAKR